jgi:hypothetical protein
VVEIDGPSHFASYDEARHRYKVDEGGVSRGIGSGS